MTQEDPSLDLLRADADALCADPRWLALLRTHWPPFFRPGAQRPLSTRVHPDDQMLLHSLRHHRDANAAVSQYFNVALQQHFAARQILDALFPPAPQAVDVLDFACGFGRLVRFLSSGDRPVRLAVSEIQPDALRFVADEFGVEVLPSSMNPESFDPGRSFDFIWVASLFSHLPAALFQRWLARLHALLSPAGVLCFSVHDEALMPPADVMPAAGLLFKPQSENAALDAQAYGTTYVTEAYVRAAVERVAGAGHPCHRIRKGLAHEQDLYAVAADRARDLSVLADFRRGAWGWVDERRIEDGALVLRGWAASLDDGALPSVSVCIDGVRHECPTGLERTDVRDAFADARLAHTGWALRHTVADPAAEHWVEVTAHTSRGETALLYAGRPGGRQATAPATPAAAKPEPAGPHVYRREIDMSVRSSLSVLAGLIAPGSRVLDLGTGSGALGRTLRQERGCAVDGVTLSADEQAAARAGYERLEVLDLEDPAWPQRFADRRYDVVVCADVLEHLRHPERVLQACRELLRPDGWLLVSIPNVSYAGATVALVHGDWKYGHEGLLDRTHLRFYTRRSFRRLLEAEGWRVERVEPIDHTWYYTEFWTPFDHLPPAVARYLLAQPDASAYQLVFAAQPAAARPGTLPAAVPEPDPSVSVAVYTATLYVGGADLSRSINVLGRIGAQRQTLRFVIPADWATADVLRLDPADRAGFMHLHAMALRDAQDRLLWQWQAAVDGAAPLQGCRRHQVEIGTAPPQADALTLALLGDDPQIDLPLPPGVMAGGGGPWQLEVVCGWPWSADYLALQGLLRSPGDGPQDEPPAQLRPPVVPTAVAAIEPAPAAARTPIAADGWLRRLVRAFRPPSPAPAPASPTVAAPPIAPPLAPPHDDCVEVIVPVYGSLELVRRCLASLLDAPCTGPWHLTVIDDASPQPEVGRWLREFALVHPEVTVLANARNLGFVATVNLGMRLAGRRDVVLLNSDTEVAHDWLDRLHRAAVSAPRVATVTPFSNNATICSYPRFCEDNPLPGGQSTAGLDRLFAAANRGRTLEIPTGVGFCMYIRRDCLDDVGEFDARTFGAGYGEENDFCMRASVRGWQHLHALDTFVFHAGGASFSERRHALQDTALAAINRLYPHYDEMVQVFVRSDPARPFREAVVHLQAARGAVPAPERHTVAGLQPEPQPTPAVPGLDPAASAGAAKQA